MTDLMPAAGDAPVRLEKPLVRPARPFFSSGPCAKPPGWSPEKLATGCLGRSHRSKLGKARLQHAIDLMRELLRLPHTHRIGIVPGRHKVSHVQLSLQRARAALGRRGPPPGIKMPTLLSSSAAAYVRPVGGLVR